MPALNVKEADIFEVQEADDFALDLPNHGDEIEVSEDEAPVAHSPETAIIVVEEPDDLVPGSDAKLMALPVKEEQKADAPKVTDWANDRDHSKFPQYLDERIKSIPKHNGMTVPGCERAKHYLKDCQREISQAVRDDFGGKIDEVWADKKRQEVDEMIMRLDQQIEALSNKLASTETRIVAEGSCPKCSTVAPMWHDTDGDKLVCLQCNADLTNDSTLSKTAGTPVLNVFMNPFERAIVATIINSSVSAGKNIEETYELLKNKYNFTPREELAIQQLVADYGYPVFKDRGRLNESADPAAGNGVDFMTNYNA